MILKLTDKEARVCSEASTVPEDEEALCKPMHSLMPHLQRAQLFLQRKEAKLELRRVQLQEPLPSFRPTLCRRSRRLTRSYSPLPPKPTVVHSFHPHINASSRRLKRPGSVADRLYGSIRKQKSASPLVRAPSPLQHSRELMQRRLDSELQQAAATLPALLSYTQFRELLQRLGMATIEDRELCYRTWTHLAAQEQLAFSALRSFLLAPTSSPLLRALHLRRLTQTKAIPVPISPPKSSITPEIQQKQVERLISKPKAHKTAQESDLRECSFTPQLVTVSPADCLRRLSQGSRHEKLYKLAAVLQMRKLTVLAPSNENWPFAPQLLPRSASVINVLPKRAAETVARLTRAREEAAWRDYRRARGLNNNATTERMRVKWRVRSLS